MDDVHPEILEQMKHREELAERRRAWEAEKKQEADLRDRQLKQARMEAWLTSRRQAWVDHVGGPPTSTTEEMWRHEYVAERADEEEAERALRLADAEDVAAGS
jgi:hypothetical protein